MPNLAPPLAASRYADAEGRLTPEGLRLLQAIVSQVNRIAPSGALGYATGGAVTQGASKSTAVTLDSLAGTITTHDAALASLADVAFNVNNSFVTAADVPVVAVSAPAGIYAANVSRVAAGVFQITLSNRSGVSRSQAVDLNFVVLKGANV